MPKRIFVTNTIQTFAH